MDTKHDRIIAGQNPDWKRSALMILSRHDAVSILARMFLMAAVIGRCDGATNKSLTTLQRLERPHLQAAHEASLGFERARRPMLSHGVYEDFRAVKAAGYTDAQVIEIVQHVALNTWTNYINNVSQTEIDFPAVTARKAA